MKGPIPTKILEDLQAEREYQLQKCGWSTSFDDKNTRSDWLSYIMVYLGKFAAWRGQPPQEISPEARRAQLIKSATLCIAAVEAIDRNGDFPARHDGIR